MAKDSLRRVLLCEVLIEEYESLDQPELDPAELKTIRDDIEAHHGKSESMTDIERADAEEELNGRLVKKIYALMTAAQKRKTDEQAEQDSDEYRKLYSGPDTAGEDLDRVVDRAVIAKIYGHVDELNDRYDRQYIYESDEAKRGKMVREATLQKLRDEALGSATGLTSPPSSPATTQTSQKGAGISKDQAKKVAAGTLRSALCLSGGGIRSATFNLGILQGLARHGLLSRFDYLSTVSGGGFIGGWLSAWIARDGIDSVNLQLTAPPKSPLQVEPQPIEHLRIYSNYLSPQPGLLSADTWTLIASVLRNLLLNWIIFLPVLFALLLLPRLWTSILFRSIDASHSTPYWKYSIPISLAVALLSGMWAILYIGWNLPSANSYNNNPKSPRYKGGQGYFIWRCLIWLVISAIALAVFLWASRKSHNVCSWEHFPVVEGDLTRFHFFAYAELLILPGLLVCLVKVVANAGRRRGIRFFVSLILVAGLIVLAQALIAYLAIIVVTNWLRVSDPEAVRYAIFAVPVLLLLKVLGAILIAGLSSWVANDDDQEWWARAGAWVFIVMLAWIAVNFLVLYGPLLILTLKTTYQTLTAVNGGISKLNWTDIGKILATVGGVISGFITILGGFSSKTPANAKEAQKSGVGGILLGAVTTLVAPIFLGFVFILISLATDLILVSRLFEFSSDKLTSKLTDPNLSIKAWHIDLLQNTPVRLVALLILLLVVLVFFLGPFISTNAFSLQFLWRNRIIRAYLGASNRFRRPNGFTGFDTYDNLQMYELRKQPQEVEQPPVREGREDLKTLPDTKKLLHVLNLALNLTGGEKLQWQDRRAESFTISPLHCGSYWLGYRRAFRYGGREGISLGAAVAISGAFVSPNMGFMMTSPVVRFLMALFNVRFGAWLGNPGPAGDKPKLLERVLTWPAKLLRGKIDHPFQLDSPTLSVLPFIAEAFGDVDDKAAYVYLSDGGHFENLGLYEMVLRRCRFIVVSDASTDPDYSFQSLAMSIRQIRVDLGVPIDIAELSVTNPSQNMKNKYCAIGTIRYSCVDRNPKDATTTDKDYDGVLIYIKPSLIGEEPRDVVNYWQDRQTFPQEVITDQWFSEAQFESYRALGSYIIDAICGDSRNPVNLAAFAAKVRDHNQLDFRAFREQISYLALEHEFKTSMGDNTFPNVFSSYRRKVREFMDRLLR
ncbi:MAG TPA: patatin-like phospholipase family protein [Pyrinomonadaceae bacterium]|nr:patatin-like phospholipase family protein [Pyrinomonadaceae bacterium]